MATREIIPAAVAYATELAGEIATLSAAGGKVDALKKKVTEISALADEASVKADALIAAKAKAKAVSEPLAQAEACRDLVFTGMEALREPIDKLEKLVAKDYWPVPTYEDLLFSF
jgi:glutamine synthetase